MGRQAAPTLRLSPLVVPCPGGATSRCTQVIFLPALCINRTLLEGRGTAEQAVPGALHSPPFSNRQDVVFFCTPRLFTAARQSRVTEHNPKALRVSGAASSPRVPSRMGPHGRGDTWAVVALPWPSPTPGLPSGARLQRPL